MERGEVVADRFVIERLAGRGGMGSVYLAQDRLSGDRVALKMLDGRSEILEERFFSEARALASVQHPAVVRYVAQGVASGSMWLAMEWLEGCDLADRLARGRLDLTSALGIGARAADGIAAAHASGVIHRDLKPSNLFLVNDDPRVLKVLDFGVARLPSRTRPLTKTGQMVGTVGFMAPEQIGGERDLDRRADIFALGCVLFECITGRAAFAADSMIAIIAKVLREDPIRPSELEPHVPPELDDLVLAMLSKNRSSRPDSASQVAEQLRRIGQDIDGVATVRAPLPRSSVTGREQRLVSVILVAPPEPSTATQVAVSRVGARYGADISELGEGASLLVVSGGGSAKDQAARAASCAIALRTELIGVSIALGTGLAEPTHGLPVGPAIDRAAALLESGAHDGIPIDEVTAALLDDRFDVTTHGALHVLVGTGRVARSAPPPARGTPFVGREKEMAIVEAVLAECLSEPVSRAVVVTGHAGAGKSRLRREALNRVLGRDGARAVVARADVVGSGSALSLVRQIVERLIHMPEGESREARGQRVARYVDERLARGGHLSPLDIVHAREFIGEGVGAKTDLPPSAELSAARNEPRSLAEWLRRTFANMIREEARIAPLMIVLEDLHWGDEASVEFIGEARRRCAELPLFVLALARTEVWEVLPRLREVFEPHEVRLGGLTPRAAQRLAEAALGRAATPEKIAHIVARAEGNPFFLEELARSTAEGRTDTSETVLAIVQSRIQRLDPEARRLLRAASVFGRVFRRHGVAGLLGVAPDARELEELLIYLEDQALVERATVQDLSTDAAFAFRHDLVRDAAYATLPESDRPRAHLLAAEWLERMGESDAAVLAEHFERAKTPDRAIAWLVRAAEQAQNAGSQERVIAFAVRGAQAGATGLELGKLRGAEALARAWGHDWRLALPASTEALSLLPRGSTPWFRAAAVHFFAAVSTGNGESIGNLTSSVIELAKDAEATGPYGFAAYASVTVLSLIGVRSAVEALLSDLDARGAAPSTDFGFVAWRALARAHFALVVRGAPGEALRDLEIASCFAPGLADGVIQVVTAYYQSSVAYECGDTVAADQGARALLASSAIDSLPYVRTWAIQIVARAAFTQGRFEDTLQIIEPLLKSEDELLLQRVTSLAAQAYLALGRLDEARSSARAALGGTFVQQDAAVALTVEAQIELAMGLPESALRYLKRAIAVIVRMGCTAVIGSTIRLTEVRTHAANGSPIEKERALDYAQKRIQSIASEIGDVALRKKWLELPDNLATLSFATV